MTRQKSNDEFWFHAWRKCCLVFASQKMFFGAWFRVSTIWKFFKVLFRLSKFEACRLTLTTFLIFDSRKSKQISKFIRMSIRLSKTELFILNFSLKNPLQFEFLSIFSCSILSKGITRNSATKSSRSAETVNFQAWASSKTSGPS